MSDPLPGIWHFGFIWLLVMLNGFFVTAEYAIAKARISRMEALAAGGNVRARYARQLVLHPGAYLAACQLGITFVSLALGWLGKPFVADAIGPVLTRAGFGATASEAVSWTAAFTLIAMLHIALGELVPKAVAVHKAEKMLMLTARAISGFHRLALPFLWVINGITYGLLRLFRVSHPVPEGGGIHTEEEIRHFMQESNKSGLIDNTELALVDNIFAFVGTTAREIMIPRTEMICLNTQLPASENMELASAGMRTRYPVCDGDKDHVIGFIHMKDLIRTPSSSDYLDMVRPILAVPESIRISALLKVMQRAKTQIAILVDEYGGTSGLVTLEDIMEEIVGEIQDEFDQERPGFERTGEGQYSVDGLMLIEEVNGRLGLSLDTEDYDTIGGWMYGKLDATPPRQGQCVTFGSRLFLIEETDNKRIVRIRISQAQQLADEEGA